MNLLYENIQYGLPALIIALVVIAVCFEFSFSYFLKKHFYDSKDTFANFAMYAGYLVVDLFWIPVILLFYTWASQFSLFKIGTGWWLFQGTTPIYIWFLLFILDDFCFYLFHRTSHKLRFLWAAHVTHHSSNQFNLTVGLRQTWLPYFAMFFWLPLILIGFDPTMVLTMQLLSLTFQAFLHTQAIRSYGPLDAVLNSPSHHRVHHGCQSLYVDKNFGGSLIIWDKIFGTFQKETEKPKFGIGVEQGDHNPFSIAFREWWLMLKDIKAYGPRMLFRYDRKSND